MLWFKANRMWSKVFLVHFELCHSWECHNRSTKPYISDLSFLSSLFADHSLLLVRMSELLDFTDLFFWKRAHMISIRKADVCLCVSDNREGLCTWLDFFWPDANWSQTEEGEDDKGDDDEGQLKGREWQFHLHNYTRQSMQLLWGGRIYNNFTSYFQFSRSKYIEIVFCKTVDCFQIVQFLFITWI